MHLLVMKSCPLKAERQKNKNTHKLPFQCPPSPGAKGFCLAPYVEKTAGAQDPLPCLDKSGAQTEIETKARSKNIPKTTSKISQVFIQGGCTTTRHYPYRCQCIPFSTTHNSHEGVRLSVSVFGGHPRFASTPVLHPPPPDTERDPTVQQPDTNLTGASAYHFQPHTTHMKGYGCL